MSYITWYNEIFIESMCMLFCFYGLGLTLCVLTPCRFLHFRKYFLLIMDQKSFFQISWLPKLSLKLYNLEIFIWSHIEVFIYFFFLEKDSYADVRNVCHGNAGGMFFLTMHWVIWTVVFALEIYKATMNGPNVY